MKRIAIIGAGQLGSRHLQGVRRCTEPLDIWVVDPGEQSLEIARQRYEQVEPGAAHTAHFAASADELPDHLDLAIVATGSMPRLAVTRAMLHGRKVDTLILEKFLFPQAAQYEEASRLIAMSGTKAYVNCPRRMYPSFKLIRSLLPADATLEMTVEGSQWGLCCNAIHYIDIFMSLCGAETFRVDTGALEPKLLENKRPGYVELQGTLTVTTPRGDKLTLICADSDRPMYVNVNGMELDEIHGTLQAGGETWQVPTPFQSQLTDRLVQEPIVLTDYETSKSYHLTLLSALLEFVNGFTGRTDDSLPIT